MEKFKAVFVMKDGQGAKYVLIHRGSCLYKDDMKNPRRDVGFKYVAPLKLGDMFEIEFVPEGNEHWWQNPYCRKLQQIDVDNNARLRNLLEATEIMITEAYSTKEEVEVRSNQLDNGTYFIENIYLMEIHSCFEAIKKYFQQEKQATFAKQIKKIADNFYETRFDLLGIQKGENTSFYAEGWDPISLIKKVKKQHFSILTPNQKVVGYIHQQIQNEANKSFAKITEICNSYLQENTNAKTQD